GLRSFRLGRVLGLGRSGRLCSRAKKRSPLSLPTSYLFIRELTPLKLLRRSSVLAQFGVACCPCALDHLPRQYGTKKSKMLFSFISSLRIGLMSAAMMRLACSAVGRVARSSVIASPPSQNALLDCIRHDVQDRSRVGWLQRKIVQARASFGCKPQWLLQSSISRS